MRDYSEYIVENLDNVTNYYSEYIVENLDNVYDTPEEIERKRVRKIKEDRDKIINKILNIKDFH